MKKVPIDEVKIPMAMEIIEKVASLMAERDCVQDQRLGKNWQSCKTV